MKYLVKLILAALAACAAFASNAQAMTTAQQDTVRAFACLDVAAARPLVVAGDSAGLRTWLNTTGTFIVWRTKVTNDELGDAMNGTEVAGLSSLNMQRLQVLAAYSGGSQNMARADRRAAFDAVFSGAGGAVTRASMATLWKRAVTRAEQALASGTGTTLSPGLTTYEGEVGELDVALMLFNPNGTLKGC